MVTWSPKQYLPADEERISSRCLNRFQINSLAFFHSITSWPNIDKFWWGCMPLAMLSEIALTLARPKGSDGRRARVSGCASSKYYNRILMSKLIESRVKTWIMAKDCVRTCSSPFSLDMTSVGIWPKGFICSTSHQSYPNVGVGLTFLNSGRSFSRRPKSIERTSYDKPLNSSAILVL